MAAQSDKPLPNSQPPDVQSQKALNGSADRVSQGHVSEGSIYDQTELDDPDRSGEDKTVRGRSDVESVISREAFIPQGLLGRPSLERKIIRIQRDVLKMGALVEHSCLLAREALCDRNLDSAKRIPVQDKQIDKLYRQIEVECTNLLTLEAPVTQDLRLVSTFTQIVRDLERIGDYAKSIGGLSIKLFPYEVHECMGDIETMLDRCRSMVALCLRSLSELDPIAGRSIKQKDDVVDEDYDRLYEQLVNTPCQNGQVEAIVLMVLVIRSLERIADHATNVGKRVTFVVTGERF